MNKKQIARLAIQHRLPCVMVTNHKPTNMSSPVVQGVQAIDRVNAFALDVAGAAVTDFLKWIETAQLEDGKSAVDQYKDHLFDSLTN